MQELMQKHYEQLARATISQLRRRGFEAEWFATAEEAKAAALRLLPEGCTVAWGGSATIRDMGLTEAVHAGNWKVIDRDLAKTPEERAAQQLIEEYKKLNDAATRREEWMAVQAIMEGQIHVIGEGVNEVIEFGFTNKVKLDTAKQWGKSGATPLDNLGDWVDMVLVNGFANVDHAIMGKVALRKFLNDEGVQKLLDNRRIEMGLIHPKDLDGGVKYIGHLNDPDLDIYTYNGVYLDDWTNPLAPETKPLIDDNKIALMPSNPDFMRAYARCSYIATKPNLACRRG